MTTTPPPFDDAGIGSDDGGTKLTKERVFALSESLLAAGQPVNQRTVLAANGGRGSNSTIVKYLRLWKDQQAKPQAKAPTLPDAITEGILSYVRSEIATGLAQLNTDLADAKSEADAVIADNNELEAALSRTAEALKGSQDEVQRQVGVITQLSKELAEERAKIQGEKDSAEQARRELVEAKLRLEGMPKLQEALDQALARAEKAQDECNAVHRANSGLTERVKAAEEKVTDKSNEAIALTKQLADANAEIKRLTQHITDLTAKAHAAEVAALKEQAAKAAAKPVKPAPALKEATVKPATTKAKNLN